MIVLNVEDRVVGIVVDSVSDVIPLSAEQIRPTRNSAPPSTPASSPASAPTTTAC